MNGIGDGAMALRRRMHFIPKDHLMWIATNIGFVLGAKIGAPVTFLSNSDVGHTVDGKRAKIYAEIEAVIKIGFSMGPPVVHEVLQCLRRIKQNNFYVRICRRYLVDLAGQVVVEIS